MPLSPGDRLDQYELVSALGAGGMGEVWLARDLRLERTVAIKVLPADVARDVGRLARFEREARAASLLNHPNVCTIYALGEAGDGRPYLAMEYVEGRTLRQRLQEGPVPLADAVGIGTGIAAALSAAHAQGIAHRDIKPENVMIRHDGLVKVLDFGLAKLVSPSGPFDAASTAASAATQPGSVMGTVTYMSPEQARGERVDPRTDIWSLGAVLYELTTGRVPFNGKSTTDVLVAILEREPPPLARFEPGAPAELQRIIGKTLRKSADERYQSARDLQLDLQALADDLKLRRSGSAEPASAPAGWSRPLVAIAVLTTCALVAVVAGLRWRHVPPEAPQTRHEEPAAAPRLSRLTYGGNLQADATWSPDGRFIAYASDRSGNFDIWVQPVAGGDPVQVTHSPAADTQPDWSPDGTRLVFRSERDGGGLFVVPVLGGAEQRLTTLGQDPRWSPDGKRILFALGQLVPGMNVGVLQVAALDGSPPVTVLPDFTFVAAASWHPDGRVSVLGTHRTAGDGFYTMRLDGSGMVKSAVAPDVERQLGDFGLLGVIRFCWDPRGTWLYLDVLDRGVQNLWRAHVDRATLALDRVQRLTTGTSRDARAAVSPDGHRVAYTSFAESVRLWALPFDAATARVLGSGEPFTEPGVQVGQSDLSSDGRQVVYEVQRSGTRERELWQADLETGRTKALFDDDFYRGAPRWAADGRRFAYFRSRSDSKARTLELMVGSLDGVERSLGSFPISDSGMVPRFVPSDWSADATALIGTLATGGAFHAIALWPAAGPSDGPSRTLLTDSRYNFWQERLSPNHKWLAFVYVPTAGVGYPQVAFAPALDPNPQSWKRIAPEATWVDKPRWSPDGRLLYVLARDPRARFNVWAIRVNPETGTQIGHPVQITHFDRPDLVISPDVDQAEMSVAAHRLVLTMKNITGSIWLLDGL